MAAAAWTVYVWITRILLLARQPASTAFKLVHLALAVVSIAFGLAVGGIGWSSMRSQGRAGIGHPEIRTRQPDDGHDAVQPPSKRVSE